MIDLLKRNLISKCIVWRLWEPGLRRSFGRKKAGEDFFGYEFSAKQSMPCLVYEMAFHYLAFMAAGRKVFLAAGNAIP